MRDFCGNENEDNFRQLGDILWWGGFRVHYQNGIKASAAKKSSPAAAEKLLVPTFIRLLCPPAAPSASARQRPATLSFSPRCHCRSLPQGGSNEYLSNAMLCNNSYRGIVCGLSWARKGRQFSESPSFPLPSPSPALRHKSPTKQCQTIESKETRNDRLTWITSRSISFSFS